MSSIGSAWREVDNSNHLKYIEICDRHRLVGGPVPVLTAADRPRLRRSPWIARMRRPSVLARFPRV